jgi:RHS repeat-associated protein
MIASDRDFAYTYSETYYVYDALGRLAAEISDDPPAAAGTSYMFTDMLGSVRAITSQAGGSGYGSVTECYDYLPFGRMLSSSDNSRSNSSCYPADPDTGFSSSTPQKFTGKERDAETGLDYFGARYYSGALGRFMTSDPGPFVVADPQSWNRYSYVRNSPLRFIDPKGKELYLPGPLGSYLMDALAEQTGLALYFSDAVTGRVQIDKKRERNKSGTSQHFADLLEEIIGSKVKLTVIAGYSIPDVQMDNYYAMSIDMADYYDVKNYRMGGLHNPEMEARTYSAFAGTSLAHAMYEFYSSYK